MNPEETNISAEATQVGVDMAQEGTESVTVEQEVATEPTVETVSEEQVDAVIIEKDENTATEVVQETV